MIFDPFKEMLILFVDFLIVRLDFLFDVFLHPVGCIPHLLHTLRVSFADVMFLIDFAQPLGGHLLHIFEAHHRVLRLADGLVYLILQCPDVFDDPLFNAAP